MKHQIMKSKIKQARAIAEKYSEVFFTYSEDQEQVYFNFDERIVNAFGDEIINETALKIEKEMMDLGFAGALLQSEIEEVDFQTLAFDLN